ncbi:MAG: H-NS histone family protein [Advenella sp.]|nr:H-NS histone family protein [Advenella sp.]
MSNTIPLDSAKEEHKPLIGSVNELINTHNITPIRFLDVLVSSLSSATDIVQVQKLLEKRINEIRTEELGRYIQEGKKMAQALGIDPALIAEGLTGKQAKNVKPVKAKYRSKDNPEATWSGRGKRPAFITNYLAENPNNQLEDLLIND